MIIIGSLEMNYHVFMNNINLIVGVQPHSYGIGVVLLWKHRKQNVLENGIGIFYISVCGFLIVSLLF